MTESSNKWFYCGALIFLFIVFIIVVTIPSRWKIQGDLENSINDLSKTLSDVNLLCENQCDFPYPTSFAITPPLSEKERISCNQNCENINEMKKSWGLEFIYKKYPYMVENKYYYYSSIINCLTGLGGCPTAFLREELGL